MTTSTASDRLSPTTAVAASPGTSPRGKTAHLKIVPPTRALREQIRARCSEFVAQLDKSSPMLQDEMERVSRALLVELGLPAGYVGWTMVALASEFWRDQVAAVPVQRRMFLLPHCLKHFHDCPPDHESCGPECTECGACSIADFRHCAEELGYRVLVAEGSPAVLKVIVSGSVDAILGVACLHVLEKALDKILLAGIPCMAVPLLSSDCHDTAVDADWVYDMLRTQREQPLQHTRNYVHLMRAACQLFDPDELDRLAPRLRGGPRLAETNGQGLGALDPLVGTEALGYDFLSKGGKYSRPFITLAVYDALTGGRGTLPDGSQYVAQFSDAVKRTAMSIETFHKASLVHDDIEDDDPFRYGEPTLHRKYGTPIAINVGDYLIGLGYRLVSREAHQLGPAVAVDILDCLAKSHTRLSEGQGAELLWRDSRNKRLQPLDALKIYALKTAPAFEAALYSGVRLAGPIEGYAEPIKQFARTLGIAFQILNDLNDWLGDDFNKLTAGADTLGGRPTVLLALAFEGLPAAAHDELMLLVGDASQLAEVRIQRVRQLYHEAGVFEKALRLVDKYHARAEAIAQTVHPEALQRLFCYLIDTVLDRPAERSLATIAPALRTTPKMDDDPGNGRETAVGRVSAEP
ncbi:MAG: polyprenyl synthetase family protein [Planctomycetota bacterium]|nr:polyprenyl synthetase family protein [Planctomycetota bacterium]